MKRNPDLAFAFRLCKQLGIDDPIAWFNSVPEAVLDAWVAYELFDTEDKSGSGSGAMMDPMEMMQKMQERFNR